MISPSFITPARAFVIAQFGVGGIMVLLSGILPSQTNVPQAIIGVGMMVSAIAVLLLGIAAHNQTNRNVPNIVPTPKDNTELVESGIYAYIRHPLYTGVILGSFGLALAQGHPILFVLWAVLCVVMYFKSRYEESLLREHFAKYAEYMTRTGRFFPRLR